jgi:hypothetical protein
MKQSRVSPRKDSDCFASLAMTAQWVLSPRKIAFWPEIAIFRGPEAP